MQQLTDQRQHESGPQILQEGHQFLACPSGSTYQHPASEAEEDDTCRHFKLMVLYHQERQVIRRQILMGNNNWRKAELCSNRSKINISKPRE